MSAPARQALGYAKAGSQVAPPSVPITAAAPSSLAELRAPTPKLAPERPRGGAEPSPLRLCNVSKRWKSSSAAVLEDINLGLEPASKTWIGGRNGAGKTTLLRIAAGLIAPDLGRAEVWGMTAADNRARYQQLVAFLPAGDRGLYARLTVRRQLEFWARISMIQADRVEARVEAAIDSCELGRLAAHRVDRMSMGQRQRLRIAMTFLAEPEVVLVDEPLTSLDADGAAVLGRAIADLIARDGALVWCSPGRERLAPSFDHCWVLERGRLERG